jgi:hypothetical protein
MIKGIRGGILPREILKSQVPEIYMAKSCILEVCWQLYLYVYFNVILFWANFNWGPAQIAPSLASLWAALTALAVTTFYDSVV